MSVKELLWLSTQLTHELDAQASSQHPVIHGFIARNLTAAMMKQTAAIHLMVAVEYTQTQRTDQEHQALSSSMID